MVTKFNTYRAACIFAMADVGFTVDQIKEREEEIADAFSDSLAVEAMVLNTLKRAEQKVG